MEEVRLAEQQEKEDIGGSGYSNTLNRQFSQDIVALMCAQDLSPAQDVKIAFLPLRNAR